jgi:GNAT superfamily N-acetyltransferase
MLVNVGPERVMPSRELTIVRIGPGELAGGKEAQVDAIFFAASTRTFAPGAERDAFRERWLGRYLQGGTDVVLLAMAGRETVAGYLVGALDDPSDQPRFADIAYFRREFRDLCRRYPAHLHVNVATGFRSLGIGARLLEGFASQARDAGAPGLHVVTGKDARNVAFYTRCGLSQVGAAKWNDGEVAFLGRALTARA